MCEEQLWLHGRKVPKGSPCIIIGGTTPCIQLVHPTGDVTHHYAGNAALPSCLPTLARLRGSDDLLHAVCELPALQSLHMLLRAWGSLPHPAGLRAATGAD